LVELDPQSYKTGLCGPKDSNYCLIWFSSGESGKKSILEGLPQDYLNDPVNIVYVDQTKYPAFKSYFGDTEAVILRPKKKKFTALEGGLTKESLKNLVDGALSGS